MDNYIVKKAVSDFTNQCNEEAYDMAVSWVWIHFNEMHPKVKGQATKEHVEKYFVESDFKKYFFMACYDAIRYMSGVRSHWSGGHSATNMIEQIRQNAIMNLFNDPFRMNFEEVKEAMLKKIAERDAPALT